MRLRYALLILGGLPAAVALIVLVHHKDTTHERPSTQPSANSSADTRAVIDTAPYWCDLVPQEALHRITGSGRGLSDMRDGWGLTRGGCRVTDQNPIYPLGLEYQQDNARTIIERQLKQFAKYYPVKLPKDLGHGLAVYAPMYVHNPPYVVSAAFQCGEKQPLIGIEISKISKGRDFVSDLTELMRIAEKRYGVLRKCVPGPLK